MATRSPRPYPLRIAVGLGAAEREQVLLPNLTAAGDIVIAGRCLAAEQLLAAASGNQIDALLVAADLHRLSETMLAELLRTQVPLVMLTSQPNEPPWASLPGPVLAFDADAEAVAEALFTVARQGRQPGFAVKLEQIAATRSRLPSLTPIPGESPGEDAASASAERTIIAIGGGPGSPGRTTVALNLAAALGIVVPTVLVEADLAHSSLGAFLDADITRNLSVLAHTEPESPQEWDRAIEQEIQPLHPASPHGVLLCGVAKSELRTGVSSRFFERLLPELQRRYRYVVLDVGSEVVGVEWAVHRAALAFAKQVLLVTSADLLGLHSARMTLGLWQTHIGLAPEHLALVINKEDRRYHYGRADIAWSLQAPVAAIVPYDYHHVQRALAAQRPVLLERSSRAAAALLDLATRLHAGQIVLPQESTTEKRALWPASLVHRLAGHRRHRHPTAMEQGGIGP
jgi:MinD-like ATPase involved in chromosome partitioning or flagellar assembly